MGKGKHYTVVNGVNFRFLKDKDIKFIEENYKTMSVDHIAEILNTTNTTVRRVLDAIGIGSLDEYRHIKGYVIIGNRRFLSSTVNQDNIDFIKNNFNLSIKEIIDRTGINGETLRHLMRELGINRKKHIPNVKLPYGEPEFEELLNNPRISSSEIAVRYNVCADAVRQARNRKDIMFRRFVGRTNLETKVKLALDELDIAYREEIRVGTKCVDFYLGNKTIVEADGRWTHTPEKDAERDTYLKDMGYKVIHISESEIENSKEILRKELKGMLIWVS